MYIYFYFVRELVIEFVIGSGVCLRGVLLDILQIYDLREWGF